MSLLHDYDWPGNIRELQNVIERAVILSDGERLRIDERWLQRRPSRSSASAATLRRLDPKREKEMIETALFETRGQVSGVRGAAAKLGIPRSTLESKIRLLGISKNRFKPK